MLAIDGLGRGPDGLHQAVPGLGGRNERVQAPSRNERLEQLPGAEAIDRDLGARIDPRQE